MATSVASLDDHSLNAASAAWLNAPFAYPYRDIAIRRNCFSTSSPMMTFMLPMKLEKSTSTYYLLLLSLLMLKVNLSPA